MAWNKVPMKDQIQEKENTQTVLVVSSKQQWDRILRTIRQQIKPLILNELWYIPEIVYQSFRKSIS